MEYKLPEITQEDLTALGTECRKIADSDAGFASKIGNLPGIKKVNTALVRVSLVDRVAGLNTAITMGILIGSFYEQRKQQIVSLEELAKL